MAGSMGGGALMMVDVAPEPQGYGDEELSHHLFEIGRDLLARHASRRD